jgi:DNA-binding winged helix-turn-helix (wHTH) protein/tetratricopeptide (TPR) repeat protein
MLPQINNIYRFENFELNASRRTLSHHGEKIPLAPKTFEVLLYLVSNAGRVLSKQDLLQAVWPGSFVEESNLTQHVFWLRKALGENSGYIVTIPGRGYQFTPAVEMLDPRSTELVLPRHPVATPSSRPPLRPTYWAFLAIAAVITLLISWGARHRLHGAVPGDHHEVILADFENSTGDPDFDRTLKTLLVIDLNQSPYLFVAGDSDVKKVLKLMNRPVDADFTPGVAREVCERLNDQAILAGLIARFGQKYLVTLTASDCSDGKILVQTKAVAATREDVIRAVDTIATDMRERLGEPLKSRHTGEPVVLAHTFSFDALKAYSQARTLHTKLKYAAASPFYKHAIELDPNFADAWAQLANCYNNMGESQLGTDAMARAYALRDQADEPARLRITAMYEYWNTGDRHAAVRAFQTWASMYPNQTNPWVLLGQFQGSLGRPDLAVDALQHAAALSPNSASAVSSLAGEQLYDGRLDDAKATCRKALSRGLDNVEFHRTLLEVAFLQHNTPDFNEQMAWFHDHAQEEDRDAAQADLDSAQGKFRDAIPLYLHIADLEKTDGLNEGALEAFVAVPGMEADAGLTDAARDHFKRYQPVTHLIGPSFMKVILTAAQLGQVDLARKYLQYMVQNGPHDTDVHELYAPMGQAAIDLAEGKPTDGLARLPSAAPWEFTDTNVPALRGRLFLAAHQPDQAAREFRTLIDHPFTNPLSPGGPLAWLGLARSLEMQANHPAARQAYETFFTLWKDADPNLPVLKQAHAEYARMN